MPDVHPELMYQVGATPHFTEKAKEHCAKIAQLSDDNKPLTICPPEVLRHGFSRLISFKCALCEVSRSISTNCSHHSIYGDDIHPQADPKWRFFWRIGERPPQTDFNHLNAPQVIPAAFPDWSVKMDAWGNLMLAACETAAEMAAHGFHLPANAFTDMMKVRACMFFFTLTHLL